MGLEMNESICRICLRTYKVHDRTFSVLDKHKNKTLAELFQQTTGYSIEGDESQIVCDCCRLELIQCSEFIQKCKRAQEYFKRFVSVSDFYSDQMKIEKTEEELAVEVSEPQDQFSDNYDNTHESDQFSALQFLATQETNAFSNDSKFDTNEIQDLNEQEHSTSSEKHFSCDLCKKKSRIYKNLISLYRHKTKVHRLKKNRCPFCNREFKTFVVENHKAKCKFNPINGGDIDFKKCYKCQHCGESSRWFRSRFTFELHLKTVHPHDKTAKCKFCPKHCYPDLLRSHERCCYMNPNRGSRPKHERRAVKKTIVECPYCGKTITSKHLPNHIKLIHKRTVERIIYCCDFCPAKSFNSKNRLINHMTLKHLNQTLPLPNSQTFPSYDQIILNQPVVQLTSIKKDLSRHLYDETDEFDDFTVEEINNFKVEDEELLEEPATNETEDHNFDLTNDFETEKAKDFKNESQTDKITCDLCKEHSSTYKSIESLEAHKTNKHNQKNPCPFCNRKITLMWFAGHKAKCKFNPQNGEGIDYTKCYKCQHCGDQSPWYKNRFSFELHLKLAHPHDKTARCQHCLRYFYPDLCDSHERNCYMNPKRIERPEHERRQIAKKTLVMCSYCAKMICSKYIKRHIETKHEGKVERVTYFCDLCNGKSINSRSTLINHMKTIHLNQLYTCKICGASFKTYPVFDAHRREKHPESFPLLECPLCPFKTTYQGSFSDHKKRHLGDSAKKFSCHVCNMKFWSNPDLKRHLATHSDRHSFMCEICGNSYKTKKSVMNHKSLVHSTDKGYECPVCKKISSTNKTNRMHITKHHPEYQLPPPGTVMKKNPATTYRNPIIPLSYL